MEVFCSPSRQDRDRREEQAFINPANKMHLLILARKNNKEKKYRVTVKNCEENTWKIKNKKQTNYVIPVWQ